MKVRFSINENGELADRDGRVLGRLTSLTIEAGNSGLLVGTIGGGVEVLEEGTSSPKAPSRLDERVEAIWQHFVSIFDSRAELNAQRRRVIENALKVATVEECCRAITGLSRSPHHNGQNDQQRKYLDIRYALRGNGQRGESNAERIAAMGELATAATPRRERTPVVEGRIREAMAVLRRRETGKYRDAAIAYLTKQDIAVRYDADGYPTFEEMR